MDGRTNERTDIRITITPATSFAGGIKTALSYLICKKPVFLFIRGKMSKNSYKINQSQYQVINSDYMNTNDL